jgi:hypothetical protein
VSSCVEYELDEGLMCVRAFVGRFYGADWSGGDLSLGEAGEALTVVDKNEAW